MAKSAKHLLIGSTEAHSGKSTTSIALGTRLQALGFKVGWGKPMASKVTPTEDTSESVDVDLGFVPEALSLSPAQQLPTLYSASNQTFLEQLGGESSKVAQSAWLTYADGVASDIVILEGPSSLEEGARVNLSLPQIAHGLAACVVLVVPFNAVHIIDSLISAQQRLGNALVGVIFNQVEESQITLITEKVIPYLEALSIPVLAALPKLPFLGGIRVSELVSYLDAAVLCCGDHLDLVVENLKIGAMNVNAALRFFGQGMHQAVVTGGDRRDLQIAALETSTHCLILTGQIAPSQDVIVLAEDREVPVLSVETDTLTTIERIDGLFGKIPLQNPDKVPLIQEMLAPSIDVMRLLSLMDLEIPTIAPRG